MIESKNLILHILADSHFEELQGLGRIDEGLRKVVDEAKDVVAKGHFAPDNSQENLRAITQYIGNGGLKNGKWVIEGQALSLEKNLFPVNVEEQKVNGDYYKVLREFAEGFKKVEHLAEEAFLNTVLALMEKYLSTVPCQVKDLEGVSLFDFWRGVVGLASTKLSIVDEDKDKPYLFMKGDLSGIQAFIYSEVKERAEQGGQALGTAKSLRGKSFYVALLTDFLADECVKDLGLSKFNILYVGGGHFNIVTPNHKDNSTKLDKFREEINLLLLEKVGTSLSFNLAYVECGSDFYEKTHDYIFEVNKELDGAKTEKHKEYLRKVFRSGQDVRHFDGKILASFEDYVRLGKALPYSDYLVEFEVKSQYLEDTSFLEKVFGNDKEGKDKKYADDRMVANFLERSTLFFMPLPEKKDRNKHYAKLTTASFRRLFDTYGQYMVKAKIVKLNDTNFEEDAINLNLNVSSSWGFRFVGNHCEKNDEGDVASFSEIERLGYDTKTGKLSYPRLGVMRLDVDNLASVFSFGLETKGSFSEIASLSRAMHWFFGGYFNTLAQEYQLYVTYSGGDDAFVIGSWYNVMHFAEKLYEDFKDFSCSNEHMSFSAGVFVCDEHYPVTRFAYDAAEAEQVAKDSGKNRLHIFNHSLTWQSYQCQMDFVRACADIIEDDSLGSVKNKDRLARSFIHRLLRMIQSASVYDTEGHLQKVRIDSRKMQRNYGQLHYLFARHGYDAKKIEESEKVSNPLNTSDKIGKIFAGQILKNFAKETKIRDYTISTHYILLKTRKL